MALFEATVLNLGVVALLVPVFAEYGKIRDKAEKEFNYIAAAGILFVLAAVLGMESVTAILGNMSVAFVSAVALIGALVALVGALMVAYKLVIRT